MQAFLIDLDGTIYVEDKPVPGAKEAIAFLRDRKIPFRFLSNATFYPRSKIARRLENMGIQTKKEEIYTALYAGALFLESHGSKNCFLLAPEETFEDYEGIDCRSPSPDFVIVGDMGHEWTYDILNQALRFLLKDVPLIALQKNRIWQAPEGLCVDAGAFVTGLEYAARVEAQVIGKPSQDFFELAIQDIYKEECPDYSQIAMVGDDLEIDIGGAQKLGLKGILVRTGRFRESDLTKVVVRPDMILNSIAELPEKI